MEWLKANKDFIIEDTPLCSFVADWATFIQNLAQDGTWGDHVALVAIAEEYNVTIKIYSSLADAQPIWIIPSTTKDENTVILFHIHELHYISVFEKN